MKKIDDAELMQRYEDALEAYRQQSGYESDYDSWVAYIEKLREGFSAANKMGLDCQIPEILFDKDGLEYQINVIQPEDRISFDSGTEKTVADYVLSQLQVQRAKEEWNAEDSFEEFSDLDEDDDDLSSFEEAWMAMERDRQKEAYEYLKKQMSEIRKEERRNEKEQKNDGGNAQSQPDEDFSSN